MVDNDLIRRVNWALRNQITQKFCVMAVVTGVAILGAHLIKGSHAATATLATEPEDAAISSPATVGADAGASGSKYITFGSGAATGGKMWYVANEKRGSGAGDSRTNAMQWRNLSALPLGPGDTVNFLTDTEYAPGGGVQVTASGAPDKPITFRGVGAEDNTPACVTLSSSRSDPYLPPPPDGTGTVGATIFTLAAGANNLDFEYICGKDVGTIFFVGTAMANKDLSGKPVINATSVDSQDYLIISSEQPHPLTIRHATYVNVRHVLDMNSATGSVTNGLFDGIEVNGFSKAAFRFYASSSNVIQNVKLDGQNERSDHFQAGIGFYGNTDVQSNHNNLIRNATILNTVEDEGPTAYAQGDAVSDEEYDTGTRIESSNFSVAGDGGFDSKGGQDVVVDTKVTGAKRNFRHHFGHYSDALALIRVTSIDPVRLFGSSSFDHIQADGSVIAKNSTFTGLNPGLIAFHAESVTDNANVAHYGKITLQDCTVTLSAAATVSLASPGASVDLGNSVITKL